MQEITVDKKQVIGEVKERNKLYNSLLQIQKIVNKSLKANTNNNSNSAIKEISKICNATLEDLG